MTQQAMKPVFSLLFLLILIASSNKANAQTKVGIRAGLNYSNVLMKEENADKNSTKSIPGFHVGLIVDIRLVTNFYLQPGVLYSRKGFKQTDSWFSGSGNNIKVTVSYIEAPLNFIYKHKLASGNLLIGAGPYAGYGTGGKWKSDAPVLIGDIQIHNYGEVIFKKDVMDGEFGNYLYGKPWDFGANFLVGYQFLDRLTLQFNGQLGINELKPKVDGVTREGTLKNKGFGISVGYTF
jgi:hypothetical protein